MTELQNKPQWADLPGWVNWIAMDFDGLWCAYAEEPLSSEAGYWYSPALAGDIDEVKGSGEWWFNSLEARP
jgi:hypothetical protein